MCHASFTVSGNQTAVCFRRGCRNKKARQARQEVIQENTLAFKIQYSQPRISASKTLTWNMEFREVLFRPLLIAEAQLKPTTTDECLAVSNA